MTIHYATGGLITPEKSEFSTLCNRKFSQGHSEIMQSGYTGAQNVTCKDCRKILDKQDEYYEHRRKIESLIARNQWDKLKIID